MQLLHSKTLLTECSAEASDPVHVSFKPASAMIVESAYSAHALFFDNFFIVFLVEGIIYIYTKFNKDISITEEVSE